MSDSSCVFAQLLPHLFDSIPSALIFLKLSSVSGTDGCLTRTRDSTVRQESMKYLSEILVKMSKTVTSCQDHVRGHSDPSDSLNQSVSYRIIRIIWKI